MKRLALIFLSCILAAMLFPASMVFGAEPLSDTSTSNTVDATEQAASDESSDAALPEDDGSSVSAPIVAFDAAVNLANGWYPSDADKKQYYVNMVPLRNAWRYIEDTWYYFDNQANLVKESWSSFGGNWFYLGADGKMLSSTFVEIGSSLYAFGATGAMVTGWLKNSDDAWLYFNPVKSSGAAVTGWHFINGKWYYFASEMHPQPNSDLEPGFYRAYGPQNIAGGDFELEGPDDGSMITGWRLVGDDWYYRDTQSGRIVANKWVQSNNRWFYLGADSKMIYSTMVEIGSSLYSFGASGAMITGWVKTPDNVWLYFNPINSSGAAVKGWNFINNNWYYFASVMDPQPNSNLKPGIYMAYGRQQIGGYIFLLGGANDGSMKTGWYMYEGYWNYHLPTGVMATGDKVYAPYPGKPSYSNFDSNGRWLSYATSPNHNPAWGWTYIEVNLSLQYMWFYQDGYCVLENEVITGNPNYGWATPPGVYSILNKTRNVTMSGPGYSVFVSYWMPFTAAGHGFHDATWQPSFGGNAYTYRGSHGCVNMPPNQAALLYNMINVGTTVVIHY